MAYDGIFIKSQINEIKYFVENEHISKITQNLSKEVSFHFRKNGKNLILTLDANPNFPHIILHENNVDNRYRPTSFCMLLRKYLQGGQIIKINQIGKGFKTNEDTKYFERIIKLSIKNIDENGDLKTYFVIFEVMGKYSNIIITDSEYNIIETLIKSQVENSRLKQKNIYEIDSISNKNEILSTPFDEFVRIIENEKSLSKINDEAFDLANSISKTLAGISKPYILNSMLNLSKTNNDNVYFNYNSLYNLFSDNSNLEKLYEDLKKNIEHEINPCINYKNDKPSDFYLFKLNQYEGTIKYFNTLNELILNFVSEKYEKQNQSDIKNKLQDAVKKIFVKLNKKLDIYKSDLAKCENYEKYKKYGELISAFGYDKNNIKDNVLICNDYNDNNQTINIPIDSSISISKNIEKYYNKYNKLKRTIDNCNNLIYQTIDKIDHLSTIEKTINLTDNKNDLEQIKIELLDYFDEAHNLNLIKKSSSNKNTNNKKNVTGKSSYDLHHYKSSSGVDIYIGKNNLQNEYLTFTFASPNDTWLHIKNATGSHVIVKKAYEKLDDKTLIEAASLAAYFSDKRNETKAIVDYTLRKELKKVKGKAPGFCIYHKNYSINVKPEVLIEEI